MRLALIMVALVHLATADTARDLAWQQDLDTLSTQLPKLHPNLFFQVTRGDWNQTVADLRSHPGGQTDGLHPSSLNVCTRNDLKLAGDI